MCLRMASISTALLWMLVVRRTAGKQWSRTVNTMPGKTSPIASGVWPSGQQRVFIPETDFCPMSNLRVLIPLHQIHGIDCGMIIADKFNKDAHGRNGVRGKVDSNVSLLSSRKGKRVEGCGINEHRLSRFRTRLRNIFASLVSMSRKWRHKSRCSLPCWHFGASPAAPVISAFSGWRVGRWRG